MIVRYGNRVATFGRNPLRSYMDASGGTITYDGSYKIHTFTEDGSLIINKRGYIAALVVGGGSGSDATNYELGGSVSASGGGGGGEVIETPKLLIDSGSYNIIIGAGGAGGTKGLGNEAAGRRGGTSSIVGLIDASGGEGWYTGDPQRGASKDGHDSGSGNAGGVTNSGFPIQPASGGAGDGAVGQSAYRIYHPEWPGYDYFAGDGGKGTLSQITGQYYGGGGGGAYGGSNGSGDGGLGGGGKGAYLISSYTVKKGVPGSPNTGGGGGGAMVYYPAGTIGVDDNGVSGGSGIVVIKYRYK